MNWNIVTKDSYLLTLLKLSLHVGYNSIVLVFLVVHCVRFKGEFKITHKQVNRVGFKKKQD